MSGVLAKAGIPHTVCVATEYGEIVMREHPSVTLHCGRMDREEIRDFLQSGAYEIVVDATHPYARVVTENIRGAVASLRGDRAIRYLRLEREIAGETEHPEESGKIRYFENNTDCAKALEAAEGNILLTTGSKELAVYCASGKLNDRLYVRILPGRESLELCMEQGIRGRQILALQGPFSTEMNLAILKQYDIRHLVTKNSGRAGGYQEKLEAARISGIPVYVVEPEKQGTDIPESTFSFDGICRELEQLCGCRLSTTGELEICLAGIGMGSEKCMTKAVQNAIDTADILLGAGRMIEGYAARIEKRPYYTADRIIPYLKQLPGDACRVVILFSGDTGFYSGCKKLYDALQEAVTERQIQGRVHILPGISSVVYLASCVGENYEDAEILSMHGKKVCQLAETVRKREKTFLLTSGSEDIREIGRLLTQAGLTECEVVLGWQLSYPEEKIQTLTPAECSLVTAEGLYTCLIRNPAPQPGRLTHGRADAEFLRGERIPMTKEEIREVSICKLHLRAGAVVYDIGSGTGSIAIEIAGLSKRTEVYAIERKPDAVALLAQNRERFRMDNIQIVEALAPEGLEDLPVASHAFIGGSGGKLREILETLYRKNPRMRVVINAISLETIAELKRIPEHFPVEEEEILQLQVNRVKKIGSYHMPQAENPVWICSFTFCGHADGGERV